MLGLLGENGLPQGQELEILQQIKKIDILVILKEQSRAIIIEDKTTSSEHDNQISRYREMKNISLHHIVQHNFVRDVLREHFPESKWEQENELYKIRNGTNIGGRPWTEMTFVVRTYPDSTDKYYLFWRIDTNGNGSYLSLRFYEKFQKSDESTILTIC